eukprot:177615_1
MARKSKRLANTWKIGMVLTLLCLCCIVYIEHYNSSDITIVPIPMRMRVPHPLSPASISYEATHHIPQFISPRNKSIAWQRFFNGTGSIFIIHCRKAAGTAIHGWMAALVSRIKVYLRQQNINKNWSCSVSEREMWTYNNAPDFHEEYYESILVIALRDPIQRILSQYEFEWRWGCFKCTHQSNVIKQELAIENATFSNMGYRTFMAYNKYPYETRNASDAKYKFSNIEFGDFLRRVNKFEMGNRSLKWKTQYKIAFGAYVNNYYTWIFCCKWKFCQINRDFVATNKIEKCFEETIAKLKSFDLLLTTEWMRDIRIQLYVNQLFWSPWVDLRRNSFGMDDRIIWDTFKPYRHVVKDRGSNYMISNQNENILREWNYWDLKLYDVAKRIVFDRHQQSGWRMDA